MLAVHPDPRARPLEPRHLLETVEETTTLARLRTLSLKELDGIAGLIPALYLPNNYTRDVPSVSFKGLVERRRGGRPVDDGHHGDHGEVR